MNPFGFEGNVLDCDSVVSEFELQSRFYVHIGKDMNFLIHSSYWLNSTTNVLLQIGFGIEYPSNVDMLGNKVTKTKILWKFICNDFLSISFKHLT